MPILRVTANPFHVLCLSVDASHREVEQCVQKLIAELEAQTPGAEHYATPLGARQRTRALVEWAGKQLRDPDRRLQHEVWHLEPNEHVAPRRPRTEAWAAFGWRAR